MKIKNKMKTRTSLALLLAGTLTTLVGVNNAGESNCQSQRMQGEYSSRYFPEQEKDELGRQIQAKDIETGFHLIYGGLLCPCIATIGGTFLYENYRKRK